MGEKEKKHISEIEQRVDSFALFEQQLNRDQGMSFETAVA